MTSRAKTKISRRRRARAVARLGGGLRAVDELDARRQGAIHSRAAGDAVAVWMDRAGTQRGADADVSGTRPAQPRGGAERR